MQQSNSQNNKLIAKNTILLYIRLLFTMVVGLFTSRVILNTLGIDDYGIYNVVAGVVAMFTLLTGSLSASISRFLTFNLGKGDLKKLSVVFSTSINIMLGMAIIVAILMEIGGVWFLNNQLNIPNERLYAANWVFQFSILTFILNLVNVPFNSAIIAHERMSAFAYISILEVSLKLVIVYMLYVSPFDKLISYAALFAGVAVIIRIVYGIYCSRQFEECHYKFVYDKSLIKEMGVFAGWNFLGSGAYLFNTQGVNIITNVFFGVATNAARGVSNQVEAIAKQFVTNFTTAINPQITKSYAAGNLDYTYSLICKSSKFSYILMLFFAVPFMFETEVIMKLWLNKYPIEAPLFLRLSLWGTMFDLLGNSPAIAAWATGNIKRYYIYVATIGCLVFPLSWVAFYLGLPAYTSYVIFAIIYIFVLITKLYIIKGLIKFPVLKYYKEVIIPLFYTTLVAFIIPLLLYNMLPRVLWSSLIIIVISLPSTLIAVYFTGLSANERVNITKFIKEKVNYFLHVL